MILSNWPYLTGISWMILCSWFYLTAIFWMIQSSLPYLTVICWMILSSCLYLTVISWMFLSRWSYLTVISWMILSSWPLSRRPPRRLNSTSSSLPRSPTHVHDETDPVTGSTPALTSNSTAQNIQGERFCLWDGKNIKKHVSLCRG